MEDLKTEWGGWRRLGEAARVSQRWLRYVKAGRFKCMGFTVLDRMLTNLGVAGKVQQLEWYTIEQLLELGLWDEQMFHRGRKKKEDGGGKSDSSTK